MYKGVELHALPVVEHSDIRDGVRLSDLSISSTAASRATSTLEGDLVISSNINCFLRISSVSLLDAESVTVSDGIPLRAYEKEPFFVKKNHWIGIITETGTGTVTFHAKG